MVFGRPTRLPVDQVLGVPDPEIQKQMYKSELANELASKLQTIYNHARNHRQSSTKHMIREYSKTIHHHLYQVGDAVWFYSPKYQKLCRPRTGSYLIVERVNDVKYKIKKL